VVASSELIVAELLRAVARGAPERLAQAQATLKQIDLVTQSRSILEAAGRLKPTTLRTLDAVHLATAIALGSDLEAVVTYDDRMARAANELGLAVLAPA
jgi:predicted nucleic acid-binding protein